MSCIGDPGLSNRHGTVLGPLDKRRLRTRCEACARRRIKCEGDVPCKYCSKKKLCCVPPSSKAASKLLFINYVATTTSERELSIVPAKVPESSENCFVYSFFSDFLKRNDFAGGMLDISTIVTCFQNSSSLYHAMLAIGAMSRDEDPRKDEASGRIVALKAYRSSVSSLRSEIMSLDVKENVSGLWTTLFLGVFELMYDRSGEGWVKHILCGTSRILQLRGPAAHASGPGRSFFLTSRVFEICRSLIYSEPTFLFDSEWVSLMSTMWEGDMAIKWHPKESLFDLMLLCSKLALRVSDFFESNDIEAIDSLNLKLISFATEGLVLQSHLQSWHLTFHSLLATQTYPLNDPRTILAIIYYHAMSIHLCGIFSYRPQFNNLTSPSLPHATIQYHVESILSETQRAFSQTNLSGLLVFFPLRVAGARTVNGRQREVVLSLLREVGRRRWVVAGAFVGDLEELWGEERL